MNMEKYDVKELVEKIYELDVKVYEATGSTMGKVFPAGKDLSVKKMLKHLDEDKRHFIRDYPYRKYDFDYKESVSCGGVQKRA